MTKEEKLFEIVEDILEIEGVTLDTELIQWDSLAMISFIAEASEAFECEIAPQDLRNAEIVRDLMVLV